MRSRNVRLLADEATLAAGVEALCAADPSLATLVRGGARPPLRKRKPGFAGLASIIVAQQVSTASAAAIWGRLAAAFPDMNHRSVAAADDDALRAVGLSRAKVRTLRAVADAVANGRLPLDGLHAIPTDEAHAHLVAIPGIGPWTADVYLLFCLGHPDAFPAGDLALQEAAFLAEGLAGRPDARALAALAERWRPWRGVAAGILWAYYAQVRRRSAAPVVVEMLTG